MVKRLRVWKCVFVWVENRSSRSSCSSEYSKSSGIPISVSIAEVGYLQKILRDLDVVDEDTF